MSAGWAADTELPFLQPENVARLEHDANVRCCCFTDDSTRVLTGTVGAIAHLWDVQTSAPVVTLAGHTSYVRDCALSPCGALALTASYDCTLAVWDLRTGGVVRALLPRKGPVWSCAWSPDGRSVVSGSDDMDASLWDVSTGLRRARLEGHNGEVMGTRFSCDGSAVATGSHDTRVRLFDASSGALLHEMKHHAKWVRRCEFQPGGELLASVGEDGECVFWDRNTGEYRGSVFNSGATMALAFTLNGLYLATGSFDDSIAFWRASDRKQLSRIKHKHCSGLSISKDTRLIAAGSYSETSLSIYRMSEAAPSAHIYWNRRDHKFLPLSTRRRVETLLLCQHRDESPMARVPKDVVLSICEYLPAS
eukprot:m51a1_g2488 putative nacht and wd domain protein (364) ;mRNA; r:88113-89482